MKSARGYVWEGIPDNERIRTALGGGYRVSGGMKKGKGAKGQSHRCGGEGGERRGEGEGEGDDECLALVWIGLSNPDQATMKATNQSQSKRHSMAAG